MDTNSGNMKNRSFCFFCLVICLVCHFKVFAQTSHHEILVNGKVTESGRYVSYFTIVNKVKTGYVKDIFKDSLYSYGDITDKTVLTDRCFIGWNYRNKSLFVTDFKTGSTETLQNVSYYEFDEAAQMLVCYDDSHRTLTIRFLNAKTKRFFTDVVYYNYSVVSRKLLVADVSGKVTVLNVEKSEYTEYVFKDIKQQHIKNTLWDKQTVLLLTTKKDDFKILMLEKKGVAEVFSEKIVNENHRYAVDTTFLNVRLLAKHRVALGVKSYAGPQGKDEAAEIWMGKTGGIPGAMAGSAEDQLHLAVIDLKTKRMIPFMDTGKKLRHMISFNDDTVYEMEAVDDITQQYPGLVVYYYDEDLTRKTKLAQFENNKNPIFSSRHFASVFYKEGDRWIAFNPKTKRKILSTEVSTGDLRPSQNFSMFRRRWLLFNDGNDVWFYDTLKNIFNKKTEAGRFQKEFHVLSCNYELASKPWAFSTERDIQNYNDIVVKWNTADFKSEGLVLINEFSQMVSLVEDNARLDQVKRSLNIFTYVKENVNNPPALFHLDKNTGKEILVYQSNKDDDSAKKIVSEYISWTNKEGEPRGAIVKYPLFYDKGQKYPAVVSIYEKKVQTRNHYTNDLEIFGNVINYRNYIADGYFVIEPDIYYKEGDPGVSAAECVDQAMDGVGSRYGIDLENVGIIGHSFGGYETNFIITQSKRFKVAVSSAGVADLISMYHTVNWKTMKPDMWRLESQQWRMGKGFYQGAEAYHRNSPLTYLQNVQTPLLLIAGKEDFQVNYNQSVAMFLGLKRLDKEVNMILYKDEGHTLQKDTNKKDAHDKIKSWFDYHLKNNERPEWLKKGCL